MTIELNAAPAPPSPDQLAAIRELLIQAVRRGEDPTPLLRAFLKDAPLRPEHRQLVDLFLGDPASAEEEEAVVVDVSDDASDLRQELADLRQANDTIAAALGACPYCWGGHLGCQVCRGRGRPGYAPPDPELFDELVLPAVRRARAQQQAATRQQSRGARW